jgi:Ca2+-binding RTX toxin-like protein
MATFTGTRASDFIFGTGAGDTIRGRDGSDQLFGDSGNDKIFGGTHEDYMVGEAGNDSLVGEAGSDFMLGEEGKDTLDGTAAANDPDDFDLAGYIDELGLLGVNVNLAAGTAIDTHGNADVLKDIEGVFGTGQADILIGGNPANNELEAFYGEAGDDTIDGGAGFDGVDYNSEDFGDINGVVVNLATGVARDEFGDTDKLSNIEAVRSTTLSDELIGNAANNEFLPLLGFDYIDGGAGIDLVTYEFDHFDGGDTGILGDLGLGQVIDTGSDVDTLLRIENLGGSAFEDEIRGSAGNNRLEGFAGGDLMVGRAGADRIDGGSGSDTLRGDAGHDTITGGTGDDLMGGGAGTDRFVLAPGDDHDRVNRFENNIDKLDLQAHNFANAAAVIAKASQQGNHVVIDLGNDQVTLLNFALADLNAADMFV